MRHTLFKSTGSLQKAYPFKVFVLKIPFKSDVRNSSFTLNPSYYAKKLQGKGKSAKTDKALAKIQKLYGIESRLKGISAEK